MKRFFQRQTIQKADITHDELILEWAWLPRRLAHFKDGFLKESCIRVFWCPVIRRKGCFLTQDHFHLPNPQLFI